MRLPVIELVIVLGIVITGISISLLITHNNEKSFFWKSDGVHYYMYKDDVNGWVVISGLESKQITELEMTAYYLEYILHKDK
jgi:hypothetical protein